MLLKAAKRIAVIAKVGDDSATALDDLRRFALVVNFAQTNPLAKLLAGGNLHQTYSVFKTQPFYKFFVFRLVAVVSQTAELAIFGVKRLARFMKTALESIIC